MSTYQDLYNLRTLRVYLYYRVVLAGLLYVMYEAGLTQDALGLELPHLFRYTSLLYVIVCLSSLAFLTDSQSHKSAVKILFLLGTDLVALLIMIHSGGGITSGVGYLIIITAAIASIFLKGQLALAYVAVASILLMLQTIFITPTDDFVKAIFGAGTLGFLLFITAITFQYLSERIRSSSQEAAEKSAYAKQLVDLAQLIVTRMQTGIAVLDENNAIELINESAIVHLELPKNKSYLGENIDKLSNLGDLLSEWHNYPVSGTAKVHKINKQGKEVRISFAEVESESQQLTILYLEDYRTLIQQAQQLKLASLGRLTASIAHEIRNPLGAISHAAQLLKESDHLVDEDSRFVDIVLQHSKRMNDIIENTMSLSKRKEPQAKVINLKSWIPDFIAEYDTAQACEIEYAWQQDQTEIKMDPTHLRQILTNLFDNGLRYSMQSINKAHIQVNTGLSHHDDTTFIEVIDFGPGVARDKLQHIFEPFFTTGNNQGTGLGLYISRELCEINQAQLNYSPTPEKLSCFRINFSHHQRMI